MSLTIPQLRQLFVSHCRETGKQDLGVDADDELPVFEHHLHHLLGSRVYDLYSISRHHHPAFSVRRFLVSPLRAGLRFHRGPTSQLLPN